MSDFVIEKGIPIPTGGTRGKNGRILEKMDVGDSFLIKNCRYTPTGNWKAAAKVIGIDVIVLSTGVKGEYRVWRTK